MIVSLRAEQAKASRMLRALDQEARRRERAKEADRRRMAWREKKRAQREKAAHYRDLAIWHVRPLSVVADPAWRRAIDAFDADPSIGNMVALLQAEADVRARRREMRAFRRDGTGKNGGTGG